MLDIQHMPQRGYHPGDTCLAPDTHMHLYTHTYVHFLVLSSTKPTAYRLGQSL